MLKSWITVALRNLSRHQGYSFINIAGLAVGMAFAILILQWVQFEMSFDRFHQHFARLYLVAWYAATFDAYGDGTVGALAAHLESEYPEIARATRFSSPKSWKLRHGETPISSYGRMVDPAFLEMFSFPLLRGNPETALDDPHSMVVTEDLARKIFGDEDPVGKMVSLSDGTAFMVTGVLEDPPLTTDLRFEFLVSAELGPASYRQWDIKCLKTYVLLEPHADPQETSRKIRDVYNDRSPYETKNDHFLVPLAKIHLHSLAGGGRITYVVIFSLLAAAVLLIACINFMNLATARSELRAKEIGIKKVVGATRTELVVQFLGESLLATFIALLLALVMVELLLPAVGSIVGQQLALEYSGPTILRLLAIAVVTAVIAGSYPAFYLSSLRPMAVLRGLRTSFRRSAPQGGRILGARSRAAALRKVLVIGQFTASIIFIMSITVIFSQLAYLRKMDLGFDRDHVVLFNIPGSLFGKTSIVKEELLKHPNIASVSVAAMSLVKWDTSFGVAWEGKLPDQPFDVGYNEVDYEYLETLKIEMVAGRFFSREFPTDVHGAYVVNEAAVRAMAMKDPVGRRITLAPSSSWERSGTIIGVIKDFHTESAHRPVRPFILGLTQTGSNVCVRIGSGDLGATLEFIRQKVKELDPEANVWCRTLNEEIARLYVVEGLTGVVVAIIALLAVLISCLGLFGLAAFTAEQRTKEVGIRKVLGSSVWEIMALFVKEVVVLVAIAGAIAGPVAYLAMNRWLQDFVYRTAISPLSFCLVAVLALMIALLTVGFQARKAAVANPVDAIRYE